MQPVSSVAAFVARWLAGDLAGDRDAAAIVDELDAEARLIVEAQAVEAAARAAWLRERTGSEWSAARITHVEQRAFVELRRALQRRNLWS